MSDDPIMSRRDELEALLPFYLNGTLDGDDLAAIEAWLASDPQAQAALGEAELEFSETNAANETVRPPVDALSRFNRRLDQEAGPVRESPTASWLSGALASLFGLPVGLAWATAAAAVALLLVQTLSGPGPGAPGYDIAGDEDDLGNRPFVLVTFRNDARMADIAAFLDANGLAIAGGPSASGVFRIAVQTEDQAAYDRLLGLIAAQPFVESALAGRKPDDVD
ncbi:MAG: anti-sigma factor [Rhizobiaceae bacterium]